MAAWLGLLAEVHWFSEHSKIFYLDQKKSGHILCKCMSQSVTRTCIMYLTGVAFQSDWCPVRHYFQSLLIQLPWRFQAPRRLF